MQYLPRSSTLLGALAATVLVLPSAAMADRGHGGGPRGDGGGALPSRVATKLKRAVSGVDRAQEKADDGDSAGAAATLTGVRKNLASALKAAKKQAVAGDEDGPASIDAITRAQHRVAIGAADLLDGADATVTAAAASTLDAALDGRDDAIAHVAGLADHSDYDLSEISGATADEKEAWTESLADDDLTADGKSALEAAVAQVTATGTAAGTIAGADYEDADYDGGPHGDCPKGGGRPHRGEDGRPPAQQGADYGDNNPT